MKKILLTLLLLFPHWVSAQNLKSDTVDASIVATTGRPLKLASAGSEGIQLSSAGTVRATVNAGGVTVRSGRFQEKLSATTVNTQNNTLTVAQAVGGVVVHASVTGAGTVTTDTAANLIAGSNGVGALTSDGQCYSVYYINTGSQTLTLAGGTGVTIVDSGQTIGDNESAILLICRTSSTAVSVYHFGA